MTNPNAPGHIEEEDLTATPEDVAALYSWANLEGARYRDFSASRREHRAKVRLRAAGALHQAELRAQANAEQAAVIAEVSAQEAERRARTPHGYESSMERNRALRSAEAAARQAANERAEAASRAAAAALAAAATRREEREILDAQASAQRQAAHWAAGQTQGRELAGPQPVQTTLRLPSDPYQYASSSSVQSDFFAPSTQLQYTQAFGLRVLESAPSLGSPLHRVEESPQAIDGTLEETQFSRMGDPVFTHPPGKQTSARALQGIKSVQPIHDPAVPPERSSVTAYSGSRSRARTDAQEEGEIRRAERSEEVDASTTVDTPAWLVDGFVPIMSRRENAPSESRPLPRARWSALHSTFGRLGHDAARTPKNAVAPSQPAIVCIFSPLGGAGKTCMVATLGRALAAIGEKVLLVDTSSLSLLPFYFGAAASPPGEALLIAPLVPTSEEPLQIVTYRAERVDAGASTLQHLLEHLARDRRGAHRTLIDLDNSLVDTLATRHDLPGPLALLIPLTPDMKSVLGLEAIEALLGHSADLAAPGINAHYILTQFDPALSLHRDVREVLRTRLGDRLLPLTISRSGVVAEAFAEGMTVLDYAPDSAVAEEYRQLAAWVHRAGVASPAELEARHRSAD